MDWDDFNEAPDDYAEEKVPDEYFVDVQKQIKDIYLQDKESIFYIRQLQVMFEKHYYHWITNNAVNGLCKLGFLKDIRLSSTKGTSTRYFVHRSNRYPRRDIRRIQNLIDAYSQDHVTRGCGYRAEELFCVGLAFRGFIPTDRKVKKYKDREWTKTGHDLDFVFERDKLAYGCEIKNTLGYIDKEELEIKLEMCEYLELIPLFVMRYAPKTYIRMINEAGGFALIFETQIYELGQVALVQEIKATLGLPVICSRAIPDGIIDRFIKWHERKIL